MGERPLSESKTLLGHIAALTCICVWGVSFVMIVTLLQSFTPVEILLFRFGLAMLALHLIYPKRMGKTTRKQELFFAAAGLTGVVSYFLAQDFALLYTAASNVSVIVAISPVFTVFLTWWFLRKGRPRGVFFLGAALAVGGIALINFAGRQLELHPAGDFLAVLAALSWAVYSVLMKRIGGFGYHTIQATRRVFLYGLLFLIPVLLLSDVRLGLERFLELPNLGSILYLGLGASAVCFVLWNFALDQLGPVKVSVYVYLVPLVGVVASVLFLGETLTWLSVSGIVLVLAGLALSNRKPRDGAEQSESG